MHGSFYCFMALTIISRRLRRHSHIRVRQRGCQSYSCVTLTYASMRLNLDVSVTDVNMASMWQIGLDAYPDARVLTFVPVTLDVISLCICSASIGSGYCSKQRGKLGIIWAAYWTSRQYGNSLVSVCGTCWYSKICRVCRYLQNLWMLLIIGLL